MYFYIVHWKKCQDRAVDFFSLLLFKCIVSLVPIQVDKTELYLTFTKTQG